MASSQRFCPVTVSQWLREEGVTLRYVQEAGGLKFQVLEGENVCYERTEDAFGTVQTNFECAFSKHQGDGLLVSAPAHRSSSNFGLLRMKAAACTKLGLREVSLAQVNEAVEMQVREYGAAAEQETITFLQHVSGDKGRFVRIDAEPQLCYFKVARPQATTVLKNEEFSVLDLEGKLLAAYDTEPLLSLVAKLLANKSTPPRALSTLAVEKADVPAPFVGEEVQDFKAAAVLMRKHLMADVNVNPTKQFLTELVSKSRISPKAQNDLFAMLPSNKMEMAVALETYYGLFRERMAGVFEIVEDPLGELMLCLMRRTGALDYRRGDAAIAKR